MVMELAVDKAAGRYVIWLNFPVVKQKHRERVVREFLSSGKSLLLSLLLLLFILLQLMILLLLLVLCYLSPEFGLVYSAVILVDLDVFI